MSLNCSTTENLPSKLDLQLWLHYSLTSQDEIDRLLALEEIAFQGLQTSFIDELERIVKEDASLKCKEIAKNLLKLANEPKNESLTGKVELTPEITRELLESGETLLKQVLQKSLRRSPSGEILDIWRSHLLTEENPAVVEVGLTLLAKFGKPSDAQLALPFCGSSSIPVVKAAIDLLHAHDLKSFQDRVVDFLTSPELDIRIHAIRRLRSIDSQEAQTYLKSLMFSKAPLVRQKALRELFLFPFSEVESLYLRYLAAEPRPLLLVLAGASLAMNPYPELPIKVYDIALQAKGLQAYILQQIVHQTVVVIHASGILKEPIDKFIEDLKSRLKQRKKWLACKILLKDLEDQDVEIRQTAVLKLKEGIDFPQVREALERRLSLESSPEVSELIAEVLGKKKDEKDQKDTNKNLTIEDFRKKVEDQSFFSLPAKIQRQYLNLITDEKTFSQIQDLIQPLLQGKLERSALLTLLELIAHFRWIMNPKAILSYLKSDDPSIVAAAVRALGAVQLDQIVHEFPVLLKHDDFRVRSAALEMYLVHDKEAALQYVRGMLRSPQGIIRKNGLRLLALIDYPSVEKILMDYFRTEKNLELQVQAGFIIAANPTKEGIQFLYEAVRNEKNEIKDGYLELWETAVAAAVPVLAPDKASLELACKEYKAKMNQKKDEPPPAYSFKKVTAATKKNLFAEQDSPSIIEEELREVPLKKIEGYIEFFKKILGKALLGLAIIVGVVMLFQYFSSESGLKPSYNKVKETGPLVAGSRMEEGSSNVPSAVVGKNQPYSTFLNPKTYGRVMQSMEEERQRIAHEFEKESKIAFNNMLRDMAQHPEFRGYAEFYLNEHCCKAIEAIEADNFLEAKIYLLKAVDDNTIHPEAKILACQALIGCAYETGDLDAIEKGLDVMLSLIPENDLPKEYRREAIKAQFASLKQNLSKVSSTDYKNALKQIAMQYPGMITPEMEAKMLEGFEKMQKMFK